MSTTDITYVATIDRLERMRSSVNGNPRFRIYFAGGATATTLPDAAVSYGLENVENRFVPVTITATKSGLVFNVVPVSA